MQLVQSTRHEAEKKAGRPRRVLIIGADGADPAIILRLMAVGQLPYLARLRAEGAFGPLETTYPTVSPVAWTSLLTGCWPAQHGILDFVIKAPGGYHPALGLYRTEFDRTGSPCYYTRRAVPTVAERLSLAGFSSYLLGVPATFPPPAIHGGVLAGLGTPDLLGTFGSPTLYTTDPSALPAQAQGRRDVSVLSLAGEGIWAGDLLGPAGARHSFTLRPTDAGAVLRLAAGDEILLTADKWSGWHGITFSEGSADAPRGICRLYLYRTGTALHIYRTPLYHSPFAPAAPICWPLDWSDRLAKKLGLFAIASFPMEQAGYQDGLLPADGFLAGAYQAWEEQVRIAEQVMETEDWSLLLLHLFTVDSLQHLFWPNIDGEIAAGYRWLDGVVGRLRERAGPHTAMIVASDHGITEVARWVHLNTWLREIGLLVDGANGRRNWNRTKAFCLGYGGIYLNVKGREPLGSVEEGESYERLREELIGRLLALRDPIDGQPVVARAERREARHRGAFVYQMPDVLVYLHPGYGLAHQDGRGEAPAGVHVVEPNQGRWRAGHEGPYDPSLVPGVLFAVGPGLKPVTLLGARVIDIAPTLLQLFNLIPPPGTMDGRPLADLLVD